MGAAAGALAVVVTAFVPVAGQAGQTQTSSDEVFRLIQRVSAYVETFQKQFGSMVAEERYQQSVRPGPMAIVRGRAISDAGQETVLLSDFLLVQLPGEDWLAFRDVFERDGKKVRDREERLAKLFLGGSGQRSAVEQARSIMEESARYNIGNVSRNFNVPTLVLTLLTPAHRSRMRFEQGKKEDEGTLVEFKETSQPTYIRTTGGRDLPVFGRLWVDPADGTVRKTELHAVDATVEGHITVTFAHDDAAGMVVPVKMEERYRRGRDTSDVRGVATYSKFRRFQVSTSETLNP
jgi:hypothetical protein